MGGCGSPSPLSRNPGAPQWPLRSLLAERVQARQSVTTHLHERPSPPVDGQHRRPRSRTSPWRDRMTSWLLDRRRRRRPNCRPASWPRSTVEPGEPGADDHRIEAGVVIVDTHVVLPGLRCARTHCIERHTVSNGTKVRGVRSSVMMNKRGVLLGGYVAAIVFGSLAVAAPAAAGCSGAISGFDGGSCTGSGPSPGITAPPSNGFSTVDGIPCNSHHWATCIGLSRSGPAGGGVQGMRPGSTVSHSP